MSQKPKLLDSKMISLTGYSRYCCEVCNESYAFVQIEKDGKLLWESSYVDTDDISIYGLREEVREECLKRGIDISAIEDFNQNYVGDWEYKNV